MISFLCLASVMARSIRLISSSCLVSGINFSAEGRGTRAEILKVLRKIVPSAEGRGPSEEKKKLMLGATLIFFLFSVDRLRLGDRRLYGRLLRLALSGLGILLRSGS